MPAILAFSLLSLFFFFFLFLLCLSLNNSLPLFCASPDPLLPYLTGPDQVVN